MTRQRRTARLWFACVAGVMLAVLGWLTFTLLQLDRDERAARRDAVVQERLRLALWRMDSWFAPQLARESLRPAQDYTAYPSAPNAWTRGFNKIRAGEVMVQSPLLGVESELFRLHFEVRKTGFCSPQVPSGNERDFAEGNGIEADVLDRARAQLQRLEQSLPVPTLEAKVGGAIAQLPMLGCNIGAPQPAPQQQVQVQQQQSVQELDNRQRNFLQNISNDPPAYTNSTQANGNPGGWIADVSDKIGPLVPVWVDGVDEELLFARRVQVRGESRLQAVLVDWERLQQEMLGLVDDLFVAGTARLVRCERPADDEQPTMLASVPARLVAEYRGPVPSADLPISTILWTTWGVTLLGLCVLGFTLRAAIGFGERRARFASAVTHELRTPLTTFRMYSEMLADGVVAEPAAQQDYLRTLQRESDRLARVVENVLAWSRLEEGRFSARRQRVRVGDLLDAVAPLLSRRLAEAEMELVVRADERARDAVVETDEEAVSQMLFNLVDNAAKYAAGAAERDVSLAVRADADAVRVTVCDRGPGVAPEHREQVFVPFDRGAVRGGSNDQPGVGLGLPLARGLARDLGGDLVLDPPPDAGAGACFTLVLPRP